MSCSTAPYPESHSLGRSLHRKRAAPAQLPPKPKPKPKPTPTSTPIITKTSSLGTQTIATSIPTTQRLPPTQTTTSPSTTMPSSGSGAGNGNKSSNKNKVTGIAVGAALGIAVVVLVVVGLLIRWRNRRRDEMIRKAEQYQQQRMIGDNTSGFLPPNVVRSRNSSDSPHRVRSSFVAPVHSRGRKNSVDVEGRVEDNEIDNLQSNQQQQRQEQFRQQQPDWWGRKLPLEYFQQIPPMEELYRPADNAPYSIEQELYSNEEQRVHATRSSNSSNQDQTEVSVARSLTSSGENHFDSTQETISLHPTQSVDRSSGMASHGYSQLPSQHYPSPTQRQQQLPQVRQQQQKRLSPIRPFSPIGSVFVDEESTDESKETYSASSTYYPPPPVDTTSNPYYRPPPPANFSAPSPGPCPKRYEPTAQPLSGFYDSLNIEQAAKAPEIESTPAPPPIPRATRPISTSAPTMIATAADRRSPSQSEQGVLPQPEPSLPSTDLARSPSLQHYFPNKIGGSWRASPTSPIARSDSDGSNSFYSSTEPRMGGRMPRITRKSNEQMNK